MIPRAGKPTLFCAFVLRRAEEVSAPSTETLTVRDDAGRWTDAFRALRADMGLPPGTDSFAK